MKRDKLLIGKQSAVAEARALYRMLGPEHTVEELRDLIAVPPKTSVFCTPMPKRMPRKNAGLKQP